MAEPTVPDVILTLLERIHKDMSEMRQELTEHINTEPDEWARVLSDLQAKAFPDGDPDGHRKAHEEAMQTISDRAEFWKKMRYDLTKGGLFMLLVSSVVWIGHQLWVTILHGPGK